MDLKEKNDYIKYLESLPKKRMGSGLLLRNCDDEILVVKPSYKEGYEIPGGIVEKGESPYQACVRELKEELGIDIDVGRLLVVDYNSERENYTESLMFIFDGGKLSENEIKVIQVDGKEIIGFEFFSFSLLKDKLSQTLY